MTGKKSPTPPMSVLCWLSGHRWFATVSAEVTIEGEPWGCGRLERALFHEKICTRCGRQKAEYMLKLCAYDPEPYPEDTPEDVAADRAKVDLPNVYRHLPGSNDWQGNLQATH